MESYYVHTGTDKQGDHEVHKDGCYFLPLPENRIYLGVHGSCYGAVVVARQYYLRSNGCAFCSAACHTS